MVRALVTLLGAAGALALLYLAPEAGEELGNGVWGVALATAAAGFVLGLLYQAGGARRPGVRLNLWLFLLVVLPWLLLTIGLVAQVADAGSNIAGWTRDVVPEDLLGRWVTLVPAFALGTGLLLALSLLEPRIGQPFPVEPPGPSGRPSGSYAPAPLDDPLAAGPTAAETFRSADRDAAAVTRVTPAAPGPQARDEPTVRLPPQGRAGGVDEGERTVVIRPSDDTDPDVTVPRR